jgi:beta-glucanase (GH16 family)
MLKRILNVCCSLLLFNNVAVHAVGPQPVGNPPAGEGNSFYLSFYDEFSGDNLNTGIWNSYWGIASGYHQAEDGSQQNWAVSNGNYHVWPQVNSQGQFFDRILDTEKIYTQTYGYYEMRAKLCTGKGAWPTFWLYNVDERNAEPPIVPEIDILEAYPGANDNSKWPGWGDQHYHPILFQATVWQYGPGKEGTGQPTGYSPAPFKDRTDLSADYHIYACKWNTTHLTFYFDGREYWSLKVQISKPMFIIAALQFGSISGEPTVAATPQGEGNSYSIDYIRAWQILPNTTTNPPPPFAGLNSAGFNSAHFNVQSFAAILLACLGLIFIQ